MPTASPTQCGAPYQLAAAERSIGILAGHERRWRTLVSPLHELRQAGVLDTEVGGRLVRTRQWFSNYESRFRLPDAKHLAGIVAEMPAPPKDSLLMRLASMKNPWLDIDNAVGSIERLTGLQRIADLIGRQHAFAESASTRLRDCLGDWRDTITWPKEIWTDLGARADFYIDLGFDPNITDLPPPAFREATAGIRSTPPLVESYCPPTPAAQDADEEAAFKRTNRAHDWLQRLESNLRRFIDCEMHRVCGPNWAERRLPGGMYDKWSEKQQRGATRNGNRGLPIIVYADFADYAPLITRKDNWRDVFAIRFQRKEDIRESLQRLHPLRVDTMHSRPISQDDELLLYVEARRIMCAITGGSND